MMKFSNHKNFIWGNSKKALLNSNAFSYRTGLIFLIIFLIVAVIGIFLFLQLPVMELVIEEYSTNNILWKDRIKAEEWFHHQYIHSVEKSIVIEKFKVDKHGQIIAMESWTRSFGAGLPSQEKGIVEMKDGFFILREINEITDPIHMIPSHLYEHTFHFKEDEIFLSEEPFRRNHIIISVKKDSLFHYLTSRK